MLKSLLSACTKSPLRVMKNTSNKFLQGSLIIIIMVGDFCRHSIKKQGPLSSTGLKSALSPYLKHALSILKIIQL